MIVVGLAVWWFRKPYHRYSNDRLRSVFGATVGDRSERGLSSRGYGLVGLAVVAAGVFMLAFAAGLTPRGDM